MNLAEQLKGAETVGITGHVRPDGDCIGSVMGLYHYIAENYPQIKVDAYLETPGDEFSYIKNLEKIKHTTENELSYDIFIVLDCGDEKRIEPFIQYFKNAKKTICMDHHISNLSFADINQVVPEASSTCEVLFEALEPEKISANVAQCIYTGIIHDTGVFKYSCTSARTMEIAGFLMEKGIPYSDIIDNSFYKKTFMQNKILGKALLESQLMLEGKVICSCIEKADIDAFGLNTRQLGGIIEQLRLTDGVEVAIFIYESGENEYKVSMRSKYQVDVAKIAVEFSGGGHVRAAGFTSTIPTEEIIEKIIMRIKSQL